MKVVLTSETHPEHSNLFRIDGTNAWASEDADFSSFDGVIKGGLFYGGTFKGGMFEGGMFEGGTFAQGKYPYVLYLRHTINLYDTGIVRAGCETIDKHWSGEEIRLLGNDYNYTREEIEQALSFIKFLLSLK